MIVNETVYNGEHVIFSFEDCSSYNQPVSQVYAICLTTDGQIVISKKKDKKLWTINGGTPESGESYEETLRRELKEELSAELLYCKLIGVQKVVYPEKNHPPIYQLRYTAIVQLNPQEPDPDDGVVWQRKIIPSEQFSIYVQWGDIGDHLLKRALMDYHYWKKQQSVQSSSS